MLKVIKIVKYKEEYYVVSFKTNPFTTRIAHIGFLSQAPEDLYTPSSVKGPGISWLLSLQLKDEVLKLLNFPTNHTTLYAR